jgi:hypothetical protein
MKPSAKIYNRVLIPAAILLSCITFTPLVMPYGIHRPTLFSLPYTLWTGLILAILLVSLTYLSIRFHPGNEEDES